VTFHGRNLNTGANISVLFENVPCLVEGFVITFKHLTRLSVLLTTTTVGITVNTGWHSRYFTRLVSDRFKV